MAKRVLGNDPFQRGAAQRPADAPQESKKPARKPAKKKAQEQPRATKSQTRAAKSPARAEKARKTPKHAEPPRIEDETTPVRDPAAPAVPSPPPLNPVPPIANEAPVAPTAREAEVDRALDSLSTSEAEEAAEEAALDAVLAQQLAPEDSLEERAAPVSVELQSQERAPLHAVEPVADVTGPMPSASADAGQELPDTSRDEFPPGRQAPLSLVPPVSEDAEETREPLHAERPRAEEPPTFGSRAAGMLSLAREIAGQALASEALGQALGAANGLWGALLAGLGTRGSTSIDEYGKDSALVDELRPVLDFLYERYWRVSVQGASHLPRGACILVANHSGALPYDGLVMYLAISRERPDLCEPRWLVEDQIFHAPVLGTLFNRLGAVRACPDNALRLLDEQRPVVVFPEGYQGLSKPFAQRYQLKRFGRGGFVKLALRTGAPIVPVAIVGAEESTPLLGRIPAGFLGVPYVPVTPLGPVPLPAKWSIRFGEPIGVEGLAPDSADDMGEVQRLTERTRDSIQGMLQALLRERRSVFAG